MTTSTPRLQRSTLVWALLGTLVAAPPALQAQTFEGIVSFTSKANEITSSFDYYVKGTQVRIEIGGTGKQGAAIIMDSKRNVATMLVPGSRMYMEFDLTAQKAEKTKTPAENVVLTHTGRTAEIAGQECEEYIASSPSMKAEVWTASGFGNFMQFDPAPKSSSPSTLLERRLSHQGLFPLRMIVRDLSGKEQSRIEATRIVKQSLQNSLFSIPTGWQKMELNMMPK
jgi:hypothetical protein